MSAQSHGISSLAILLVTVVCWLAEGGRAEGGSGEWRPIEGRSPRLLQQPQHHHGGGGGGPAGARAGRCELFKVVMQQDNYYQYIQYKAHLPDMKEFTLCHWHKFYNHSLDHPVFSYGLRDQPREVLAWISNDERSSYYQLAIGGHTIYRVNYPIRLHTWYHACQSWNSRTGEWQLWVNSERVSRGFYNLLVGKTIKGGGVAITGQTQSKLGGGFGLDAAGTGRESSGFLGEVTLVQLYKAALTAGKAYNTHKHHHAHKFTHEDKQQLEEEYRGNSVAQSAASPAAEEGQTEFPFLRGMQLVPRLPVEELNVIRQQQQLQQQELQMAGVPVVDLTKSFAPYSSQAVRIFKRENSQNATEKRKRTVNEYGVFPGIDLSGLYPGEGFPLGTGIIGPEQGYYRGPGGAGSGRPHGGASGEEENDEQPPKKWSEPAEWEVMAIMDVCSGCGEDPFRKANVLSWRETSKKLYAGALYVPASQQCHQF